MTVLITLVGPMLLFNPWFTSVLQQRQGVAATFDTSQAEIERVTSEVLVDIYTDGPFDAALAGQAPLLNERERSHMHDVAALVRTLAAVTLLALVIAIVGATWLRHEPRRQGRILLFAAGGIGFVALLLAVVFAVAFEPAFLAFHRIFFRPGTFLFEPGSKLIALFPEGFWYDAALAAGAAIVVTAVVVAVIGFARWRDGRDDARPALN